MGQLWSLQKEGPEIRSLANDVTLNTWTSHQEFPTEATEMGERVAPLSLRVLPVKVRCSHSFRSKIKRNKGLEDNKPPTGGLGTWDPSAGTLNAIFHRFHPHIYHRHEALPLHIHWFISFAFSPLVQKTAY